MRILKHIFFTQLFRTGAPGGSARRSILQPPHQELQAQQLPQARRSQTGTAPVAPVSAASGHVRLAAPGSAAARELHEPVEHLLGVGAEAEGGDALLQLSDSESSLSSDSIQRRKQLQQYLASHPRTPVSIERNAARTAATASTSSRPRAHSGATSAVKPNASGDGAPDAERSLHVLYSAISFLNRSFVFGFVCITVR